jgi:aspartate/methionine/tyrosine aminotransferase
MNLTPFRYMAWAKEHQERGEIRLQVSGTAPVTLEELGVPPSAIRLARPNTLLPDPELAEAVARRYRVPKECVLPCCGTHQANYLLARTLVEPGMQVLVETPNYEGVPGALVAAGAVVRTFRRRREEGWRLPIAEIRAGLAAGARLVAVTDLHNPSGARILPDDYAALEAAAREHDAKVLVDEVYRDFLPPPVGTCFLPDGPFVVSSSLTKVYGLGGLRIGWALASPEVVLRMRDWNDYMVVNLPAPSASIAAAAWGNLDAVAARHRDVAARGFRAASAWVRGRKDVRWNPPDGGVSGFIEVDSLREKDDVTWVESLIEATGVVVVPGSMFGAPGSLRFCFGVPVERLNEGLDRLGAFLDRAG